MNDAEYKTHVIDALARIEEKVKMLPDHEKRLRWLERLAYGLLGTWALLAAWLSHHVFGSGK